MPQFAALIYETARPTPDAPNFVSWIGGYTAFGERAGAAVVGGAALLGPETATTIEVRGGADGDLIQTDGPYAETKEFLGGFYLLEAEDLDAAVALARHIPAASDGGRVEVRPLMPMM
jgi:hypothetical protein